MRFDFRDIEDPRIRRGYRIYAFNETSLDHLPACNGIYILYDNRFFILHIGCAPKQEMRKRLKEHLEKRYYSQAAFRQIFETETFCKAEDIISEWTAKYGLDSRKKQKIIREGQNEKR